MTPEPGIYPDLPFADYLAADAVSCSDLCTLLESFPARLKQPKSDTRPMEDGRIAHRLVLEGVDDIADSGLYVVTPKGFSMSHTNKHAELIARIEATGAEPISEERAQTIRGMHEALKRDPQVMAALSNGTPEVSVFWTEPRHGLLCKARFDWVPQKGSVYPDYKTAMSIDEAPLARAIASYRVAHRSAWYEDAARYGLGRDDPARPPVYLPIWQEKAPPYFVAMRPVDAEDVALARLELDHALGIYANCKACGVWPGPEHYRPIALPAWERKRLQYEFTDMERSAA